MQTHRYVHINCLKDLRQVERTVVSQPADEQWPRDFRIALLFCDTCHCVVPYFEVKKEALATV